MTRDPRAFGLPARHDLEFARIELALIGIRDSRLAFALIARPPAAGESLALQRCRRNGFADVPAGQGRREAGGEDCHE